MTTKQLKEQFGIEKPISMMKYLDWCYSKDSDGVIEKYGCEDLTTYIFHYHAWISTPLTEEILTEVFGATAGSFIGEVYLISSDYLITVKKEEVGFVFNSSGQSTICVTINDLLSAAEKENIQLELFDEVWDLKNCKDG